MTSCAHSMSYNRRSRTSYALPKRGPSMPRPRCAPACDFILLDTAHPTTDVVGATGHTHDWSLSAAIVDAISTPVVLAGGLGPDNVVDAIAATHPAGVDSETRTSRDDDRRRKDPERLRRFVERAREASRSG